MAMRREGGKAGGREGGQAGRRTGGMVAALLLAPVLLVAQVVVGVQEQHDSVSLHFVDADLRAVVQALGSYLPKPLMVSGIPGNRVTLDTPAPVSRTQIAGLLRGLLESQALAFTEDSDFIRIGPKPADDPSSRRPDRPSDEELRLYVIRLKHARAADVAGTINLLFGAGGEFSGKSGFTSGTLSDELSRQSVPPAGPPDRPSASPPSRQSASFSGAVTIVPDELTNALLIRASPHDHEVLASAVEELDLRPLQVLIEVLIVEARRNRDFSIGTSLFVPQQGLKGDVDGSIGGQTRGAGVGDLVLRLLKVGKADIDATLSASESRGDVRIISRPVLLASNNTEASFLVGSQRPFVQVSRLLPTDNNNQDRVVQYRDVGTKLRVRPTINQDGYVSLAIQQEINAATNEVAFDAPVISTREASTQVFVRDGQTIMLGGLKDQQRDRSRSGVPVLSGLPIIGALFGSTSRNDSDTELYLFITPRILRTDADADSVTAPHLPEGGGDESGAWTTGRGDDGTTGCWDDGTTGRWADGGLAGRPLGTSATRPVVPPARWHTVPRDLDRRREPGDAPSRGACAAVCSAGDTGIAGGGHRDGQGGSGAGDPLLERAGRSDGGCGLWRPAARDDRQRTVWPPARSVHQRGGVCAGAHRACRQRDPLS